ncbi:lanthionine synthetase LanC family protein [Ktedonobacter racemifer]|uniref:lanthionine synthetase LanC family protein n=1 Tax=Ktedonobacter racemifer TaxID=363277 RepID=UPI00058AE756|nr:lanthionine synthetase LanC family protein [Ktedonobacter racemifer]
MTPTILTIDGSSTVGVPGIALGRIASLQHIDDAMIREEIEVALQTTITEGFEFNHEHSWSNHSLYHGDCGNLETVLLATCRLDTGKYREHLEHLTAQLLGSIGMHGWSMGVPLNVETPGLMMGLSGIGYELLRLAEPERVPSVLLLAPPVV